MNRNVLDSQESRMKNLNDDQPSQDGDMNWYGNKHVPMSDNADFRNNKYNKIKIDHLIKYKYPRYSLEPGNDKGIQGNLNSCYLDTTLFAIFTFNMFLDNMLFNSGEDADIEELRALLRNNIVYPLRKNGYVSYVDVTKFRDKLQSLSPGGKFQINERDPEELLEQLFRLLTPSKYLFRTVTSHDPKNAQDCFLTQLFYQSTVKRDRMNFLDMVTLSFLEFDMFIALPPKCLIFQLPRDGKSTKMFKTVCIPAKLDITAFILSTCKKCAECETVGIELYFCRECSQIRTDLTYFCKEHRSNCKHNTIVMPSIDTPFRGNVVLDLVSVLCIERNHYVTFVKTNNINDRWIYFNSMETIDNGRFIPKVRDTNLHGYFNTDVDKRERYYEDLDIDKIERYAFICIYKFSPLEFCDRDFNSGNETERMT